VAANVKSKTHERAISSCSALARSISLNRCSVARSISLNSFSPQPEAEKSIILSVFFTLILRFIGTKRTS
jgi:hypothetical protein